MPRDRFEELVALALDDIPPELTDVMDNVVVLVEDEPPADDPDLLGRLTTALQVQADPPISLARSGEAVIAFESATSELMLRCRVIQALEDVAGPDWQTVVRTLD